MSSQAFATVCTARSQAEAELLVSVLRQAGLHPLDVPTSGRYSGLPGGDIDFPVEVPTEELEEAKRVLSTDSTQRAES